MSDSTATPPARSLELIVEGEEKRVTGFMRGLFIGARHPSWPVFHHEVGIESETFAEQLKGWVGLTEPLTHLVIDADALTLVRQAMADPRCRGLRLRDVRPILGARFGFKARVFTEEAGRQVRDIFEKMPANVALEGWAPTETKRDPSVHGGVELYSPVHHYRLDGAGRVSGPFREVLYVHEQARRVEQVDEDELELELGPSLP
jgi:hypothetical protein